MTEQEVRQLSKMSEEDYEKYVREHFPWDYPVLFMMSKHRYYLGLACLHIPRNPAFPDGGDCTVSAWRYNDEPERWTFVWRFRYHEGPEAFDSKDRKSWYAMQVPGPQERAEAALKDFGNIVGGVAGLVYLVNAPDPEIYWVRGDAANMSAALMSPNRPSWLHMRVESKKENKNPGNV